tara:strand:+ start:475 stop:1071 length:597 start_codon:yes stop_codon:yes gene_type:complete
MPNSPKLIESIEKHLQANLSTHRYEHVLSVRDQAVKLAVRHNINPEQAELAALLHDCLKELSNDELLKYAKEHKFVFDQYEENNVSLLHGKLAPFMAKNQFGIDDEVVNNAMRKHTTGAIEMEPVDMILFVADFCEPLRPYAEAETVRALAEHDLEMATLEVMKCKIRKNLSKNRTIHPDSFDSYNSLIENHTRVNLK